MILGRYYNPYASYADLSRSQIGLAAVSPAAAENETAAAADTLVKLQRRQLLLQGISTFAAVVVSIAGVWRLVKDDKKDKSKSKKGSR